MYRKLRTQVGLVEEKRIRAAVEQVDGVPGLVLQRDPHVQRLFQVVRDALEHLDGEAGHQVGDKSQRRVHGDDCCGR